MSTSRGSCQRTRPQKHQNRTKFKNDLHDTSSKTKLINSLDITGVCKRCKDIIEWKIKYKKYKPLTAPKKCVHCEGKSVKHAYHVMCTPCSRTRNACAKCLKTVEAIEAESKEDQKFDMQAILKALPERKRRTLLRYISKNGDEIQKFKSEVNETEAAAKLDEYITNFINKKCSTDSEDDGEGGDSDLDF